MDKQPLMISVQRKSFQTDQNHEGTMRPHSLKILLEQEGILALYFLGKTFIWLKFDNYGATDGTICLNFKKQ